ncbi:flagellar hook-length control protein FliK [Ferrimonas balearica]|uniref:flagellar hook-length control protein FliK n=1 Tax=Ferrimonas balearica TaxID=44012 RepID=UPI001C5754FE|nr:flagellar hook-length control protein FliK [Ferrimonas balearica]MBY6222953.1 flagellar hook-length control protein FliK [Ferrimonas balearica]
MRIFPSTPSANASDSLIAQPGEGQRDASADGFGLLMPLAGPASQAPVAHQPGLPLQRGTAQLAQGVTEDVAAVSARSPVDPNGPQSPSLLSTPASFSQAPGGVGQPATVTPMVPFAAEPGRADSRVSGGASPAAQLGASVTDAVASLTHQTKGQSPSALPIDSLPTPSSQLRLGNTELLAAMRQLTAAEAPGLAAQASDGRHSEAQATLNAAAQASAQTQSSSAARALPQWGPVTLPAEPQHWAREMLTPLRDQLRFQFEQQIKSAELRLDPPDLGRIELNVRLEGERLIVQLNAANPTVREALQSGAERLRDELGQSHGGQVDVDVGQEGEGRQQRDSSAGSPLHLASSIHPASVASGPADDRNHHQIDALA